MVVSCSNLSHACDYEIINKEIALSDADMAALRSVVEKELLHYEILNALDDDSLLKI